MNESRSSLSVDDLKTVISSSTSVLNEVDCSSAPQSVCDSLNRERCGVLVGTCGECKSGHVGAQVPRTLFAWTLAPLPLLVTATSPLGNPTPTQPPRGVVNPMQTVMTMDCSLHAIRNPISANPSNSPVPTRVQATGVVCLCRSTILQRECLSVG